MVAQGGAAPEPVLDPEDAIDQRIVLLGGARLDPSADQAGEGMQFGSGKMSLVIPDGLSVPGGVVGQQGRNDQQKPGEPDCRTANDNRMRAWSAPSSPGRGFCGRVRLSCALGARGLRCLVHVAKL